MRIEGTVASGIYGRNVTGIRIDRVDVHDANRSQSFIDATFPTLPERLPHGGMVFVHADSPAQVAVTSSTVTQTAGFGIISITSGVARTRLTVRHTRVEGGTRIGFFDIGIAALVKDRSATTRLDISDANVRGRLSRSGRNVMLAASGGGHADAHIERIASGPTGQDGIVGAVMQSPSEITIHISDSVIEDAGQMNVEGSLINLPPDDSADVDAGRVSIVIERSIIRNAGAVRLGRRPHRPLPRARPIARPACAPRSSCGSPHSPDPCAEAPSRHQQSTPSGTALAAASCLMLRSAATATGH